MLYSGFYNLSLPGDANWHFARDARVEEACDPLTIVVTQG